VKIVGMSKLRFLTSGESHGKSLVGIIEGMPSGLSLSSEYIDKDLRRRQGGYGRGGRMKIESDHAEILSGVRRGRTTGSPIGILIENRDWENWQDVMSVETGTRGSWYQDSRRGPVVHPRPGHADLAGALKFDHKDIRDILERSSARETSMRTALGSIAKSLLLEFGIQIGSYVVQIGKGRVGTSKNRDYRVKEEELLRSFKRAEKSPVRCPDNEASKRMVRLIDRAKKEGNSLGGIFEVFAVGLPVGLGSHIQWDKRLDAKIAGAIMGIQAIKGIEIGTGFEMAQMPGSGVLDEIFYAGSNFYRKTNHAGGIEGGITNGMPLVLRAAMKPIPTQGRPLKSVDITVKRPSKAAYERSDICAVPAAAVIGEAMLAIVIADCFLEKFGGDSMKEMKRNYNGYMKQVKGF
jgi:chorismate synthase